MTLVNIAVDKMTLVIITIDKITRQNNYKQNDSQGPTLLTMHKKYRAKKLPVG